MYSLKEERKKKVYLILQLLFPCWHPCSFMDFDFDHRHLGSKDVRIQFMCSNISG